MSFWKYQTDIPRNHSFLFTEKGIEPQPCYGKRDGTFNFLIFLK